MFAHRWSTPGLCPPDLSALLGASGMWKRYAPVGSSMIRGEEVLAALRGVPVCSHKTFFPVPLGNFSVPRWHLVGEFSLDFYRLAI